MPIKPIAISYQICEEIYIFCDLPSIACQKRYDECKSDSKLDTEPEKGQPDDDLLTNGISKCNSSFSRCQGENCISQVRNCLLKSLEGARQRRLRSETELEEEEETPSRSEETLDLTRAKPKYKSTVVCQVLKISSVMLNHIYILILDQAQPTLGPSINYVHQFCRFSEPPFVHLRCKFEKSFPLF